MSACFEFEFEVADPFDFPDSPESIDDSDDIDMIDMVDEAETRLVRGCWNARIGADVAAAAAVDDDDDDEEFWC